MTRYHTAFAFAAAASLAGCASLYDAAPRTVASSTIANAAGMPIGTAQFVDTAGRLHVNVSVTGLPAGTHAVHLHQVGRCQAPDFTSAGGHLNPAGNTHGTLSPTGPHLGDLPNIEIGASRTGSVTAELGAASTQALAHLFDDDGTAIVVHAQADDYRTDPTGNAGGRIACGVVGRVSG